MGAPFRAHKQKGRAIFDSAFLFDGLVSKVNFKIKTQFETDFLLRARLKFRKFISEEFLLSLDLEKRKVCLKYGRKFLNTESRAYS